MKKESKAAPTVDAAPEPRTRVIRVVIPYTEEMNDALESRLDLYALQGFMVVSSIPYGVDHMVIILQKAAQ